MGGVDLVEFEGKGCGVWAKIDNSTYTLVDKVHGGVNWTKDVDDYLLMDQFGYHEHSAKSKFLVDGDGLRGKNIQLNLTMDDGVGLKGATYDDSAKGLKEHYDGSTKCFYAWRIDPLLMIANGPISKDEAKMIKEALSLLYDKFWTKPNEESKGAKL